MKTQKVTKSSKFTQVTPNDNEYRDYQNIGLTVLSPSSCDGGTQNSERISYTEGNCHNVNKSSELLLKGSYRAQDSMHDIQRFSPERNANRFQQQQHQHQQQQQQTHELCNCITPMYPTQKTRFIDHSNSEQTLSLNRSFASLSKLEIANNSSQVSLDRKSGKYRPKQHGYVCDPNRGRIMRGEMDKEATLRRIQSPEIINIHRGAMLYEGHGVDNNCDVVGFQCTDRGFRRGQSVRTVGTRSNVISSHPKRRPAADGMDVETDDPELVFEMASSDHLEDCQCPCDHVVYSPTAYATCLQMTGPAEIQIISIDNCPGFEDKDLRVQLRVDQEEQTVSGNVSLDFDFDELVKINLREKTYRKYPKNLIRTYINQTSFCKIIDNYMKTDDIYSSEKSSESSESESICPVSKGTYTVTAATAKFTVMALPEAMMGRKRYQMEFIRRGELLLCREYEVISRLKDVTQFVDL